MGAVCRPSNPDPRQRFVPSSMQTAFFFLLVAVFIVMGLPALLGTIYLGLLTALTPPPASQRKRWEASRAQARCRPAEDEWVRATRSGG